MGDRESAQDLGEDFVCIYKLSKALHPMVSHLFFIQWLDQVSK